MNEENVDEFFKFIENEEEHKQGIYLQYLSINLSFIKKMKNKYEEIFNEFKQTKIKLNQSAKENEKEKEEHEQTKIKLNRSEKEEEKVKEELKQLKINLQ